MQVARGRVGGRRSDSGSGRSVGRLPRGFSERTPETGTRSGQGRGGPGVHTGTHTRGKLSGAEAHAHTRTRGRAPAHTRAHAHAHPRTRAPTRARARGKGGNSKNTGKSGGARIAREGRRNRTPGWCAGVLDGHPKVSGIPPFREVHARTAHRSRTTKI